MPDAGSRVVLGGATYVVESRTGDTLECHALGSPLSTICEWQTGSPITVGCMVCVSLRFSPCVADDCLRCCFARRWMCFAPSLDVTVWRRDALGYRFVTLAPPPRGGTVRGGPRGGGGRPRAVRGAASATGTAGAGPGRAATATHKTRWPRLNLRLSQKWRAGS